MSEKILHFDTYYGALGGIADIIKNRKLNLDTKHILLVPEKDTLKAEQRLFLGGGAFDVEVYSLSRWFWRLGGGTVLPPAGAVMIIKDILYDMELKCFFRSKGFEGFCLRTYETFCDLENDCVDLESLSASGGLGLKLDDLKRIYTEYKRRTEGMYVGKSGKVRRIIESLDQKNHLSNAHVYACGFGRLSGTEIQLFEIISQKALSFTRAETFARPAATQSAPNVAAPATPNVASDVATPATSNVASDVAAPATSNAASNIAHNVSPHITAHATTRVRPPITADVEIYKASSTVGSLKAAAGRIRHLLKNGATTESICVVAPPAVYPQAKRIFGEYGLPHYIDHAAPLPTSRASEYLRLLFDLKKLSRRDFVLLSKNPLAGIPPQDSDIFENYCESFLIDYLGFSRPFTLTDSTKNPAAESVRLAAAERVRGALYAKVSAFWDRLNKLKSPRDFSPAVAKFLEDACERYQQSLIGNAQYAAEHTPSQNKNAENKGNSAEVLGGYSTKAVGGNNAKSEHNAEVLGGLNVEKNKILGVLSALDRYLCEGVLDKKRLQFLIGAFLEGAGSETLEKLPRTNGCIIIGDVGIFRGEKFSHTFVIGFSEGVIPKTATGSGLITRAECETLNKMGARLQGETELNEQNEYELLQLFAASDNLFLSFVESGEQRPSPLLFEVISEAKSVRQGGTEYDLHLLSHKGSNSSDSDLHKSGNNDNFGELVRLAGSSSAGLEILILTKNNPTRLTASLYDALGKSAEKYLREKPSVQNGIAFLGKELSASRLNSYFLCPYKHFVEYGLSAARKKSGKADNADIGTAVHKVNQIFSRCGFDTDKLDGIIDEVLSGGIYDLKQNERLKLRLKKEIKEVCASFGEKLTRGSFRRVGEEIRFGENERLAGVNLGAATLRGSVDFVDSFDGYVRIIDYKTGFAKLEEKDIYYGKGLQLPLYMLAMRENGYKAFAMLYFVFKSSWAVSGYFAGFFLADKQLLLATDPDQNKDNPVLPANIKTQSNGTEKITGMCSKDAPSWKKAARPKNAAIMEAYLDYAKEVATLAAEQIMGGNIAPSPLKYDDKCACDYCGYLPACGFRGNFRIMQNAKIVSNDAESEEEDDE